MLSFEVQSRTEGGMYVTFCVRQDTIKSSVQFGQSIPKYTYSPIQKGPVPYMPVAPCTTVLEIYRYDTGIYIEMYIFFHWSGKKQKWSGK